MAGRQAGPGRVSFFQMPVMRCNSKKEIFMLSVQLFDGKFWWF